MRKCILALILVLLASCTALADNIDIGTRFDGGYSATLILHPDDKTNISIVLEHNAQDEKHSGALGLGYRIDKVVPWVAMSSQKVDSTNSQVGFAFGLNADYWIDSMGMSGTIAKMPEGFMSNARIKYKVAGIGTAHVGYVYDSIVGHGVVAGVGIAY